MAGLDVACRAGDAKGMIWLSSMAALAAPPDLYAQWQTVEPRVRSATAVPVPLSASDAAKLGRGEIVTARFDTDDGAFATGAAWIDAPIEMVWLVLNDGEHDPPGRATLRVLPAPAPIRRVHLTLDLPFPVSDRQWISDIVPNRALYEATAGQVWQRQWTLADSALATAPDKALWIKENRGAWTAVDVGDGTLLLFTVRTVLGGLLPASITRSWALKTLKGTFRDVGPRARAMPDHYVADHFRIRNPAGVELVGWPR